MGWDGASGTRGVEVTSHLPTAALRGHDSRDRIRPEGGPSEGFVRRPPFSQRGDEISPPARRVGGGRGRRKGQERKIDRRRPQSHPSLVPSLIPPPRRSGPVLMERAKSGRGHAPAQQGHLNHSPLLRFGRAAPAESGAGWGDLGAPPRARVPRLLRPPSSLRRIARPSWCGSQTTCWLRGLHPPLQLRILGPVGFGGRLKRG